MRKIHIRQVEAFRAVVTVGSMSKAAALLGISQPGVSRLIADFQDAVGFQLFRRRRDRAEPTPDAHLLFEHVDKLFYGLEEINREIVAIKSMYTGRIVISATSSYSADILPIVIAAFKNVYGGVLVSLYIHSHEQVIDWVSSGRADIGFTVQPVARNELSVRQFMARDAHVIFPAKHPLADKEVLHPKDLANLPFISFPRGAALRFQIDSLFNRMGIERLLHVEATSHHAICAFVAAGLGVALVNPFASILGYRNQLMSRPMKPSVLIELQMLWNDSSLSVCSTGFRDFVLEEVARGHLPDPTYSV